MDIEKIRFFDSHLHIIDSRFPVYENQGYLPETFTVSDYLQETRAYELLGGTVVSGSFQRQDQSYLVDALNQLGSRFVGVTQLLADTPDKDILALHQSGVRAVRFNLKRGGSEDISKIRSFASRIYELAGWHVELYIDSVYLDDYYRTLTTLPKVSIDHLGLSKSGFDCLLKLAEHGVRVKATGFGRLNFEPAKAIKDLCSANPHCLMFGTDLPSTRAARPFRHDDVCLILDTLGDAAADVLFNNAQAFYLQNS